MSHSPYLISMLALFFLPAPMNAQPVGTSASASLAERKAQLQKAIDAEWQYRLKVEPEFATEIGDARYNDRLSERSVSAEQQEIEHARRELGIFEAIDTADFPESEVLNKTLMVAGCILNWKRRPSRIGRCR